MGLLDILKMVAAGAMILFGAVMGLGSLASTNESGTSPMAEMALVFFFSILPVALGVWIFWRARKRSQLRRAKSMEKKILTLAGQNSGVLSVHDVALKTQLSLKESKKMLEDLFAEGWCGIDMDDAGQVVYIFKNSAPPPPPK